MKADSKKMGIPYCGAYCGACSWKLASTESDERHLTHKRFETFEPREKQYFLACPGCRVGNYRSDCDFRVCAESRRLEHCIDCTEFPCKRHEDFNSDGVQHHANSIAGLNVLKNEGADAWLRIQETKWTCSCGAKLTWYLESCLKCGRPVRLEKR